MLNFLRLPPSAGVLATGLLMLAVAPLAIANDQPRVNWSISIGSPYYSPHAIYAPPPAVYMHPHPVYVQPAPVHVQPRPYYVMPAPEVEYRYGYNGQPYYGQEYQGHRQWRHHRDDD